MITSLLLIQCNLHLSNHIWAKKKWPFNGGGFLIEMCGHGHSWDRTKWSLNRGGLLMEVVF
jgi:hypothetical protein